MRNPTRALAALLPLLSEGCYDFLRNTDEVASGSGSSTTTPVSSSSSTSPAASTTSGGSTGAEGSISGTTSPNIGSTSTGHSDHDDAASASEVGTTNNTGGSTSTSDTAETETEGPLGCPQISMDKQLLEGAPCEKPFMMNGYLENGPECDKDCTVPKCGDSIFNPEATQHPEQCDDGLSNSADSAAFCTKECKRNGLIVFLTSKDDFTGDIRNQGLSGIPAADLFCNEAAHEIPEVAEAQGSNFLAWLSTRNDLKFVTASPDTDFKKCGRPYYLPKHDNDRLMIAESYKDLTTEKDMDLNKYLHNPIYVTEKGILGSPAPVLTGTRPNGQASEIGDCDDFSKLWGHVHHGLPSGTDAAWTSEDSLAPLKLCSTPSHLYCFEQCPP